MDDHVLCLECQGSVSVEDLNPLNILCPKCEVKRLGRDLEICLDLLADEGIKVSNGRVTSLDGRKDVL